MKKLATLTIVLIGFCGSLAAQGLNIEIDLNRDLRNIKSSEFRALTLDSEDWIYGLSADGLPAYCRGFSIPQGESPSIKSIAGITTNTYFNFDIESLRYFAQSTNASAIIGEVNHSLVALEIIDGIRARIEKRLSANGLDYYNLYIIPFSYDADNQKLTCYSEMRIEIESAFDPNQSRAALNPGNQMEIVLNDLVGSNPEPGVKPVFPLYRSEGYGSTPNYIIITNSDLAESFALFALWKRSLGIMSRSN